jgi:SNF2 family DNA or RNA helicase
LLPAFAVSANLEIHPHQVEAALFALRSSKMKGVILADETGLGKSVEALLVMAQKWYEGKQRILLIVPIHLLHQWTQEFEEKLLLPHVSIDNNTVFNDCLQNGQANPFEQEAIVITTYDFAAEKADCIADITWDVTVFEEAHRLRKVYTGENKGAAVIQAAVKGSYKILLTATPMQNNVLDLYGLINFIDETEFTDEETFKLRYMNTVENMDELALRVQKICFRTMRHQIKHTVKNP